MRVVTGFTGACAVVALWGCAAMSPKGDEEPVEQVKLAYKTDGAIWQEGMGDIFADRRARAVGDIVTVSVVEQATASQEASTSTGRTSKIDASIDDTFGLPQDYGMSNFLDSQQPFSPTVKGDYKRDFKGTGTSTRKGKLVATVTARVEEVLPSGNLRIKGDRYVKVNREKQIIRVEGIVRPEDISPRNTILSTQMADAVITYVGRGVLGDVQGQGWFGRILDWIWPF